jgi:hypothetical protein
VTWTYERLTALDALDRFRLRGVDTGRLEDFCTAARLEGAARS